MCGQGGLIHCRLWHFDPEARRPGLPPGVAALVHAVRPDGVSCSIVNTDTEAHRTLIMQAGAFCEHRFTSAQLSDGRTVAVDGPHLQLRLAPGAAVELELGMELHVAEEPSYARPWGGGAAL